MPIPPSSDILSGLRFGALDVAACSRLGAGPRLRAENQDNLLLIDHAGDAIWLHEQAPLRRLLDGMGGHGHGREAAEAVVAGLLAMQPCATAAALAQQLDALHAELQRHFGEARFNDAPRPGTTLTMLELPPDGDPLLYHAGDSRLYEITRARVSPLTVDHVPATALAMGGQMDEAQWWQQVHGEHRPQVSQAFILGNAFADPMHLQDPLFALSAQNLPAWLRHLPDRRPVALAAGASYLLASDGLWSCSDPYGWVSQWPQLLGGRADAATMLGALLAAYEAHPAAFFYPDNVSAILLRTPDDGARDETVLPLA